MRLPPPSTHTHNITQLYRKNMLNMTVYQVFIVTEFIIEVKLEWNNEAYFDIPYQTNPLRYD